MDKEGTPRQRKLQNVCTASDYHELRRAYRFVPEPPAAAQGKSPKSQSADDTSTWQSRMARRYEAHLYREFVLADLTRYQTGQIGLRWRSKDEVYSGKGFDTCGNKHCPSYHSPGGGSSRDIEAARWASLSRTSKDSVSQYYLSIQKRNEQAILGKESQRGEYNEEEEEEEIMALSKLTYGCGLADYEVPFSYVEQETSKTELVKLRLCLRCAPMLFHGRGGSLGAKKAREWTRLNGSEQKVVGSVAKHEKKGGEETSSDSSRRSDGYNTDEDRRRKGQRKKSRKSEKHEKRRSEWKRDESEERRRTKKGRRRARASSNDTGAISDDISIEGKRAEEILLASLAESS
jgi:hypothetical protein